MNSKKVNITIPEKNLNEINEFCKSEGVSKSWLIREAASQYIALIKDKKVLDKKRIDMEWAQKASEKLRGESTDFHNDKRGFEIIRESRDRKQ